MMRATVCVMALIAGFPSDGSAQAAPTRESSVDALEAGQRVRVRAADALSIEGVFLGLEGQDMLLRTIGAEQARRVPVDRLEALWVRKGATKKGSVIGAIAGGVLGAGFGVVVGEYICNDEDCEADTFLAAAIFGAVGAGGGAVVGALIGYVVQRWSLVWP